MKKSDGKSKGRLSSLLLRSPRSFTKNAVSASLVGFDRAIGQVGSSPADGALEQALQAGAKAGVVGASMAYWGGAVRISIRT
jgi:hypothetical protein